MLSHPEDSIPTDARTSITATVGRSHVPATHHHTGRLHADHLTAVVAIGALFWLLGTAFVISWRDGGHKLRRILDELDGYHGPHAEQRTDAHTANLC